MMKNMKNSSSNQNIDDHIMYFVFAALIWCAGCISFIMACSELNVSYRELRMHDVGFIFILYLLIIILPLLIFALKEMISGRHINFLVLCIFSAMIFVASIFLLYYDRGQDGGMSYLDDWVMFAILRLYKFYFTTMFLFAFICFMVIQIEQTVVSLYHCRTNKIVKIEMVYNIILCMLWISAGIVNITIYANPEFNMTFFLFIFNCCFVGFMTVFEGTVMILKLIKQRKQTA